MLVSISLAIGFSYHKRHSEGKLYLIKILKIKNKLKFEKINKNDLFMQKQHH
jgi:hypothetical protein